MSRRKDILDDGFVEADSGNLPDVTFAMLNNYFFSTACFGSKMEISGRQNYGDQAIGRVQIKRDQQQCIVKCKITPEHKIRNTPYTVIVTINEKKKSIETAQCQDCVASTSGCKHAVAFLFWLWRKSEEPATTDVESYWRKSAMSSLPTDTFITTNDLAAGTSKANVPSNLDSDGFLKEFIEESIANNDYSLIVRQFKVPPFNNFTFQSLMCQFVRVMKKTNYDDFIEFLKNEITDEVCVAIANKSVLQYKSDLWMKIRFGRVTASKIYDAVHCKTEKGALVKSFMGSYKIRDTEALKRGRVLEDKVLRTFESQKQLKTNKIGIVLDKNYVLFGASPDAITDQSVIEIKCPSKEKTVSNYITKRGNITAKYLAQVQLQMLLTKRKSAFFVVADPDFENNNEISIVPVYYNDDYTQNLIKKAEIFWINNIFPLLFKAYNV